MYSLEEQNLHKLHNLPLPNEFFIPGHLYKWTYKQDLDHLEENRQPFAFLFVTSTFGNKTNNIAAVASVVFAQTNKGHNFFHPKEEQIFLCTNIERKQSEKSTTQQTWKITFLFEELSVFDLLFDGKIWQGRWEKVV
jgi:hypothetical protein